MQVDSPCASLTAYHPSAIPAQNTLQLELKRLASLTSNSDLATEVSTALVVQPASRNLWQSASYKGNFAQRPISE